MAKRKATDETAAAAGVLARVLPEPRVGHEKDEYARAWLVDVLVATGAVGEYGLTESTPFEAAAARLKRDVLLFEAAPLRFARNGEFESTTLPGLMPLGEGAGYAGGIVSAALDGFRAAMVLVEQHTPRLA